MSEVKVEIVTTQFSHPSITTGMHTNGPCSVWLKVGEEYLHTDERSVHKARQWLEMFGDDYVEMLRAMQ